MLFGVAISMLGYVGFVLIDTWLFQKAELQHLRDMVTERQQQPEENIPEPPKPVPLRHLEGLVGLIEIPRLGLSSIVMEGTSGLVLRRAVGHIQGTALPGEEGNVGLSGHRDTFFRQLRNIELEDHITLTTPRGEHQYTVVSTQIVDPSDVTVLDADGENEVLTLVTCYPFSYVGPAPQRFIVRAEKVQLAPNLHQKPSSTAFVAPKPSPPGANPSKHRINRRFSKST